MSGQSHEITTIYDAVFAREGWTQALDIAISGTTAKSAMLYDVGTIDEIGYPIERANSFFSDKIEFVKLYDEMLQNGDGSGLDNEGVGYTNLKRPFVPHLESEIWELNDAYRSRPEIKFCMENLGFYRRFVTNLSETPTQYTGLIVHYDVGLRTEIPQRDMMSVGRLSPHLGKALEMHRLTRRLRAKYEAALTVLDHVEVGILVVSGDAEVLLANKFADERIRVGEALSINRSGRLFCSLTEVQLELQDALRRISLTSVGENDDSGHFIEIPRLDKMSLLVIISPLRDSEMELQRGLTGALVTVIDPHDPIDVKIDLFTKAFGLTSAEQRVAALMARGLANKRIAERLEVGTETVKSQVSAILTKCDSKNRLGFIWRVFQFSPPIR